MINLELVRFGFGYDSTLGKLYMLDGEGREFLCYTLEDERREVKVHGETCIPKGSYQIALRKEGDFHDRYTKRFGELHKGMLHLQDVPNFKWILVHIGNTDEDSAGCLLVGSGATVTDGEFHVTASEKAYRKIYPQIAGPLARGERVAIHITEL